MITFMDLLFIVDTGAIFFHGFYYGRKNTLGIFIATCILAGIFILTVGFDGLGAFNEGILSSGIIDDIVALIYIIFWWVLGFIISGFHLIKKNDVGVIVKSKNWYKRTPKVERIKNE